MVHLCRGACLSQGVGWFVGTIETDECATVLRRLAESASGPALVMTAAGALVFANASARALMAQDERWCVELVTWLDPLDGPLVPGRGGRTPSSHIATARGLVEIIWSSLAASDHLFLVLGRDGTFERQLRSALTESRQRYKDLVEISSDFAWETGPDGRFVFVSPGGALGFAAEALIGRDPADLAVVEAAPADPAILPLHPFRAEQRVEGVAHWMVSAAGSPVCLSVSALPLFDDRQGWIGARGVCKDITEQLNRSFELAQMRMGDALLNRIGQTLRDHVEDAGSLQGAAEEMGQMLGASGCLIGRVPPAGTAVEAAAEAGARPFALAAVLAQVEAAPTVVELPLPELGVTVLGRRADYQGLVNGAVLAWRSEAAAPWSDETRRLLAGIAQRLGVALAKIAHTEHLRTLSERDALTGVFNRRGFTDQLVRSPPHRRTGPAALLYIDLDNFKAVNDTLGHGTGDTVLRELAQLLTDEVRPGDVSGRLGGDEFVLWLDGAGTAEAEAVAQRLLAGAAALAHLSASPERPLSLSIGIAVRTPESGETLGALIQRADQAMYVAKAAGKGRYSLAPPAEARPEGSLEEGDGGTGL